MLNTLYSWAMPFFQKQLWLVDGSLLLLAALFFTWLEIVIYRRLEPRLGKKQHVWLQALLHALYRPLQVLIWGVAISLFLEWIPFQSPNLFDSYLAILQKICVIAAFLWFFLGYINQIELLIHHQIDRKKSQMDKTSVTALCQLLEIIAIVIVTLMLMQNLGVSVSAILAFGGMGGLAAGFAAKDTLANFLGGTMIFVDRPFSVGEHVRSPDQEIEGTVERIGWRLTKIRTPDKRLLYVPNGVFSNISIENISRMTHRRIKTNFSLRYSDADKIDSLNEKIVDMLHKHEHIDNNENIIANLQDMGASNLNFMVVAHTQRVSFKEYQKLQQEILLNIIKIIKEVGAECATQSTTLYLAENTNPEKLY